MVVIARQNQQIQEENKRKKPKIAEQNKRKPNIQRLPRLKIQENEISWPCTN